jgi:hypothetical protein
LHATSLQNEFTIETGEFSTRGIEMKDKQTLFSTRKMPEISVYAFPKPEKNDSSIIVHVLEDIPNFVGMDNTYDLKKDDMVTLPSQFATLLSSRGKVKIVEA